MKNFLLLFIMFFPSVCSLAQEREKVSSSVLRNSINGCEYTIAGIQVKGAETYGYEQSTLRDMSGLSIGSRVLIPGAEITAALKAFLKQGFSWGKVVISNQVSDSIWLEFVLQPTPIISDIIFNGVKKREMEDLSSKIGILCGQRFSQNAIDLAKKRIKEYFESRGFDQIEVQIQCIDDLLNDGKVIVNIVVSNKEKTKIRHIYLFGNYKVSDCILKEAMMKTIECFSFKKNLFFLSLRRLFSSHMFVQEQYKKDLERIILKYNEQGYCDAFVVSDSVLFVTDKKADISITINEGNQYKLRTIRWVGNTIFSSEKLGCFLKIQAGDVYNQKKMLERLFIDEDAVANLYYNNGYIFSSINPIEVCIDNDSVDLEIRISEGIQSTINQVVINGNKKVYENVIRRELLTKPGQLFRKENLMRSMREIAKMGYFDPTKIDARLVPDVESGMVDIYYNLISKPNDQVEFSAGYGRTGLVGCASLKLSNFSFQNMIHLKKCKGVFLQGEGQSLIFSAQTNGRFYQSYNISFLDPWFGGRRPNGFSLSSRYMLQPKIADSITNDSNKCITRVFNFSTGYGKRLDWLGSNYVILTPSFSYQRYWLKNWQIENVNTLTFGFSLNRNSTNNSVYPQYGSIFSLSVNATPPYSFLKRKYGGVAYEYDSTMSRWAEYHKWKFKGIIFTSLCKEGKIKRVPVLMNRIECGFIGTYNSKKYNSFETFDMGGNGMPNYSVYTKEIIGLRGYEVGSITPEKGGYAYSRLVLECRYPLILDQTATVYGLLFLEAGNAWETMKACRPFQLKRAAGIGIRTLFPMIGLIGFDWAYGFDRSNRSNQISGAQIHFVLGQEF